MPIRAEQALAIAVKRRPSFAHAWVNFGLAGYSQGAVDDAKIAFARARQTQPGPLAETANLTALLRLTGGYEAGETLLRQAPARNPPDAAALEDWRERESVAPTTPHGFDDSDHAAFVERLPQ